MVPRYSRPDMTAIWEAEARFRIWIEIEAHATEALADLGVVPKTAADALWAWRATNPTLDVTAIDAIEPVSTQVIPRERLAMFFATLGVIASSIERLAIEIRHLQRTEVLEAEEYFSPGQKGSSAMPHKRNPVLTENLTGLARMVRGYVTPALENVALWHERDISHSSVERYI